MSCDTSWYFELNWKTNSAISFKHMLTQNTTQYKHCSPLSQDVCIKKRGGGVPLFTPVTACQSLCLLSADPGHCLVPGAASAPGSWHHPMFEAGSHNTSPLSITQSHQHFVHTRLRLTAYYLGWSNVTPGAAHKQRANGHRKSHDD